MSGALGRSAEDTGWEDAAVPALDQRHGERSEPSAPPGSRATLLRPRGVDRTSDASTFSPTLGLVTGAVQERLPSGQTGLPVRRAMQKGALEVHTQRTSCTGLAPFFKSCLKGIKTVQKVTCKFFFAL